MQKDREEAKEQEQIEKRLREKESERQRDHVTRFKKEEDKKR